jgi:Cu/Zn superoxide dismutase
MRFKLLVLSSFAAILISSVADARPFRPGLIPNGFSVACFTCHVKFPTPGDGPRNAFGQEVETRVTPLGMEAFWGPELAALDSDGDGFTNGEELGDPDGSWSPGDPSPGHPALIARPGSNRSTPPRPEEVVSVNAQVDLEKANTPIASTFFTASLDGNQEVPAVTTSASGTATIVLDRSGLHFRVTVNGLSGPITGSHFHQASAGASGGVVHGITESYEGNTATGTWEISPDMISELLAGNLYINVHTSDNPGGEIRGQVTLSSGVGFSASLSGDQAVPALDGSGSGTGAFVLDGNGLHYWVTTDGLTGPISASHFHNAPAGENGGVVHGITESFDGSTATGSWEITPEMITELLAERLYVNVHTASNPSGEIRGQVTLAAGVRMVADINGGNSVPAIVSDAAGTGTFALGESGLNYQITVSGLTGPISASHFHKAAPGENGGVVRTISFDGNTASGAWRTTDRNQPLTSELIGDLLSGNIYVNIHTEANPSGEIRGQVSLISGVGFEGRLDGNQGPSAVATSGTGTAALNWDGEGLHFWITVDGLSGPITASHYHSAPAGTNGGVVHPISDSFSGNTASGLWSGADMANDLWAGNLYINVHTAENPSGEIRAQVLLPSSDSQGLNLAFSRSISGRLLDYAWSGTLNSGGQTTVNIISGRDFSFRRVGASGYYSAVLTNSSGRIIDRWNSIPLRGGRETNLLLTANDKATIAGTPSPLVAASKSASVVTTHLNGLEPVAPRVSFSETQKRENGIVVLPVTILRANNIRGGDFTLEYNPSLLTFERATIGETELTASLSTSGSLQLSFDALNSVDQTAIKLTFVSHSGGGDVRGVVLLTGLFYDRELMPLAIVDLQVQLNGFLPQTYALLQNYPNPFNPATQIRYNLPEASRVRLTVYNALGQEVARLVNAPQGAGTYTVAWDAAEFSSGLYYYQLEAGGFKDVRKMLLIK